MNNVFRLVWNRSLGRLVVASEAARSYRKAGTSHKLGRVAEPIIVQSPIKIFLRPATLGVVFTFAAMLSPLGAPDVEARKFASGGDSCVSGAVGTAVGRIATPNTSADPIDGSGTYSLVAGCDASGNNQLAATAYGAFSQVTGKGGAALGFNTSAAQWATAIGAESRAVAVGGTALGFGSQATARNAVAIGSAGGDGTTPLAETESTIASGLNSIAIGSDGVRGARASGDSSIALGARATASDFATIAVGDRAEATVNHAIAIGQLTRAAGSGTTAVGVDADALQNNTTALGRRAWADANAGTAVGLGSRVETGATRGIAIGGATDEAVAIEADAEAALNAIALGHDAKATGSQSISIGTGNQVSGSNSGAIGDPTTITGAGSYSLGSDNSIDASAAGVFGNDNSLAATATGSRIVGNGNDIDVADAFVMGNGADVTESGGVALGSGSLSNREPYTVLGYDPLVGGDYNGSTSPTWVGTSGSVGVGNPGSDITRQITGVAAGSEDTDAVNVAQLKSLGNVPLTFAGDSGSEFDRKLGVTTNVKGGNTGILTDGNIGVVADGTDTLNIKLAENVDLGTTGSVVMGDTTINNNGLTINGGPSVTNAGIDAGGDRITNVQAGDVSNTSTDAVNGSQLHDTNQNVANNTTNIVDKTASALPTTKGILPTTASVLPRMKTASRMSTKRLG